MKSNCDKCHLLVSITNNVSIRIDNFDISNSKCEKLLGVKFDHKLSFDELCKNSSQKLHALAGVAPYMNISKSCILMNVFFT